MKLGYYLAVVFFAAVPATVVGLLAGLISQDAGIIVGSAVFAYVLVDILEVGKKRRAKK